MLPRQRLLLVLITLVRITAPTQCYTITYVCLRFHSDYYCTYAVLHPYIRAITPTLIIVTLHSAHYYKTLSHTSHYRVI